MEETKAKMLPDDVLREILLRVSTDDVAALFRCGITCKHWSALVANHSFLRCRWPDRARHPSSLLGFFVQQQPSDDNNNNNNNNNGLFQPVFLPPSSGSVLGSQSRSLASFIPGLPYGELDGAVPLAARHGLLLVRLAQRANDKPARLAVCNLLAGTCDVLPSLNPGVFSVNCAIITDADYLSSNGHRRDERSHPLSPHSYSTSFKVLAIVIDNTKNHYAEWNNLYTFSSADDPSWSEPTNCFDAVPWCGGERYHAVLQWRNKVVVCGGMAHWLVMSLSKYYVLRVSVETGDIISLTKLSIPKELHFTARYGGPTLFATAAGSLSMFWLQEEEGLWLDTWAQTDDGAWLQTKTVELKPPRMWDPSRVHVWSGEKSGVLIIVDTFQCVDLVDVESGAMEDVSQQFQSSWGMMVVPMEIDWHALFLSRLGRG